MSKNSDAGDVVEECQHALKDYCFDESPDGDISCEEVLCLIVLMSNDDLVMFLNLVCNILDLMDVLIYMGLYDDDDYVLGKNDYDVVEDENSCHAHCEDASDSYGGDSILDVTEDDLLQLATETEQDEGEKEDLIQGLRTLRFDSQEEVVISLRSKFMELNDKKEEMIESDEELPTSPDPDNDLVLSPEKYKTCPASSFKDVLKGKSSVGRTSLGSERSRAESTTSQEPPISAPKPKKSRSMPDIVDEKKSFSHARKMFEKQSSASNVTPKPKVPWLPSGRRIAPKQKPDKFFSSSTPKPTPEVSSKGLRERVLTRAAELNKKPAAAEKKSPSKTVKRTRAVSKTIEEKAKLFSNEGKYGVVYSRPTESSTNSAQRPPWRYGKSKAPAVSLPTIKPFIMRKTTRKHELGLNREQLKDLQSGLSQVFDHSHRSCSSPPARFGSLASSPLNRIPSSASRVASATFASSHSPQTEYQGCEVCRLKEAMRNSPVSHKLRSTPHHCATPTSASPAAKAVPEKPKQAKKSLKKSTDTNTKVVSPKSNRQINFLSSAVPLVLSLLFFLFLISLVLFFYFSFNIFLLYHMLLATALRFLYHCYRVNSNDTVSDQQTHLTADPRRSLSTYFYTKVITGWRRLSKIHWKDAVFQCHFLPYTAAAVRNVFSLLARDFVSLGRYVFDQYSYLGSLCFKNLNALSNVQRYVFFFLVIITAFFFFINYFLLFLTTAMLAAFIPLLVKSISSRNKVVC